MDNSSVYTTSASSRDTRRKAPMSLSEVGKAMSRELQKPAVRRIAEAATILAKNQNSEDTQATRNFSTESDARTRGLYFGRNVATSMWWKYQYFDETSDSETSEYNAREENSYRTEPEDGYRFSESKMKQSMKDILERFLMSENYDPKRASGLVKKIAEEIKDVGKSFDFKRYKLVVRVDIGSKHMQQVNFASKFLWNAETDSFATVSYENRSLYAVATVFGVYLD